MELEVESGYTVYKKTEAVDSGGAENNTWSIDTSIGTSGAFSAQARQLSGDERLQYASLREAVIKRFYTETSGFTIEHAIQDPDGNDWNIINVDNSHDLDEFYQIDAELNKKLNLGS